MSDKFFRVERFPISGIVRVHIGSYYKDMVETDLVELAATVNAALASAESASMCRCVLARHGDDSPVCNRPYFNPSGRDTFCLNRLIEGEYDSDCGHDRACHPASQPSNTGEQKGESFLCCGCGNDYFRITPSGALCVFCGSSHEIILSGPPRLVP
jgi:hypothetical protein